MFIRGIVLLLSASCIMATPESAQDDLSPLVSREILKSAGLGQLWQNPMAVKPTENVHSIKMLGDNIYAITSSNYLLAVRAADGKPAFGLQLAKFGHPIMDPAIYDNNELLIVSASDLLSINTEFGTVRGWRFPYRAACPAVRNKNYLYISATDNKVHVYDANSKVRLFDVAADDDTLITSVLADPERVIFASIGGQVVSMRPETPAKFWSYAVKEKITAPLVADANAVYAASWDTNLYKLRLSDGKLLWKCQLPGLLKESPVVTEKIVYQYVPDRGISAIDKETGKEMWAIADATAFMSQNGKRSYLLTISRTAVIVDNATGKVLQRLNFADVQISAANPVDARIFAANRAGKIQCIVPQE